MWIAMTERDYSKFLRENGRLNVTLLPRAVYVEMVKRHRAKSEVIEKIYDELYWLWDLREAEKKAAVEGRDASRAELAAEIEADMSDSDWWKVTEAFEEHLITTISENPQEWAEFLDPVYDQQEQDGWVRKQ